MPVLPSPMIMNIGWMNCMNWGNEELYLACQHTFRIWIPVPTNSLLFFFLAAAFSFSLLFLPPSLHSSFSPSLPFFLSSLLSFLSSLPPFFPFLSFLFFLVKKLGFYLEAHFLKKLIMDHAQNESSVIRKAWDFFSETLYWLSESKQFRLHIKYALFTQALHALHTVTALEELVSDK